VAAVALAAPAAQAASTTVVLSQVAFRGPNGGNDEVIQLHNVSPSAQDIGGWVINGTNSGGTNSTRATIPVGTTLGAGKYYLIVNGGANGYDVKTVPGDLVYTTSGITDTGGVQLRNAAGTVIDAAGHTGLSGAAAAWKEGVGLLFPATTPANDATAFIRKDTADTDANENDFTGPRVREPANCGATCIPVDPSCPADADGITAITTIQDPTAPCENKTVKIKAIVTGIDDVYGSNFNNVFVTDSGLWVQQETRDPQATTSSGMFVAGIARTGTTPEQRAGIVGSEVTVSGRVETKFGLVQLVPPGVGPTNQDGKEVPLDSVATVTPGKKPLPVPVVINPTLAQNQDPITRPYYRSLQGMRVQLPAGIATGGGTTKFRDVFVEPGTEARRLFRANDNAAITTPWSDAPAELGISGEGGGNNPADPRMTWFSRTQVNLDLFDVVKDVVGPLTFSFSFYKIMPQPVGAPAPTIERGSIHAAYPPTAPEPSADTLRVASFNVENFFPVGKENDGHTISPEEYDAKAGAIVAAIRNFLKEPDVIAVQEVAVFGPPAPANALTGLAQKLGNYTPYITTNNDGRGIATGFLVKDGTTASDPRLLGAGEIYNNWSEGACDLAPNNGKLFDRAPFVIDVKKGDLAVTAMSNHFASQSHENACRIAEAEFVRQQAVALQAAGKNVLVAGDLNDFQFSQALGRLTQGNTLANLWSKAPAGLAYSYKFNGHLQTLDHILVTAGLNSRVLDMRYVHFDNDYYERSSENPYATGADAVTDGTGISDHDPPVATFDARSTSVSVPGTISGSVPATLSLTLGTPAQLGPFVPGVGTDYTTTMTATVTSTGEDAALSVIDPSSNATGRLVNGSHALASPLQVSADGGAFAPLRTDNGPLALLAWNTPVTKRSVQLGFKQTIGETEGLRTGAYSKTLTFTLSTLNP
jgi:predicted extracellular nuclease